MQCICLIGRQGTTIRQGKKGGYTSVNLCVKQASRPGSNTSCVGWRHLRWRGRGCVSWLGVAELVRLTPTSFDAVAGAAARACVVGAAAAQASRHDETAVHGLRGVLA